MDSCSQRDIKLENTLLLTTDGSFELPDISMSSMHTKELPTTTEEETKGDKSGNPKKLKGAKALA
ncbi:hypothetical protein G9A89_001347 [Geosiphon pyriformis]|nr:hypothetical protein G9A89_001347 [Geosiphon pyriformis]